jgi:GalNAc-alpha-(1->4)-GalNAc-alpha-(1->3)-diNAcBac-PP-undecaprenol alpha-1,4-N-acetyl-D-galactosaminyltransferase
MNGSLVRMDKWWKKLSKMKNKKILIINNGLACGGIERASVCLANYFSGMGHQVDVLALCQSKPFFLLNTNISFKEPDFIKKDNGKNVYAIKMMFYVRERIKQVNPDVILAFGEWTNPFVIVASLGLNIPIYVSDRMNPLAKLPFISEFLRKIFYKKTSGIIAQTNFAKEILLGKTKSSKITVIPNPVNAINRINCEIKKRIVSVGRLSPEKGHKYLLQAFSDITDKSWELSIVGDGSERVNLERMATELGIDKRVIFHGHLKDFTLQLSEAQIFVLPSLKEGFPNALIEAMSVPLACISTDFLKSQNEIITDGVNGLNVPIADVTELTKAMNTLISDENLRNKLAENAKKIREDLAFDKIAKQYLNLILEYT